MTTKALVLAGGGLFGIGWETGMIRGLEASGLSLSDSNLVIGTSAGAVVGTNLRQDGSMSASYERFTHVDDESTEIGVDFDPVEYMKQLSELRSTSKNRKQFLQSVGKWAVSAKTVSEDTRLHVIAKRLSGTTWPQQLLAITCVDAATGELEVFTVGSKIPLVQAVAASCAIPGIWPATTINDRKYFDGGLRSTANADLAAGFERILILLPSSTEESRSDIDAEIRELETLGCDVMLLVPNRASLTTAKGNPLDPACLSPSAKAGYQQGTNMSEMVNPFWLED